MNIFEKSAKLKKPYNLSSLEQMYFIFVICLVSSSLFECRIQEQSFFLDKLLAYEPKVLTEIITKRSHAQMKKNLRDCETIEECKEIFKLLINEYSVGKKSDSFKMFNDQPRKTFFKWG
ncbi:unnamed protein product [Brachionus calyciflorus]|uniref:Uncharacterized protein n=1 Tax=Brachionus calyciflorus TaxID=104777 RepID=A0A813QEA8_9BILA|nr:unnamed protein product [Brachionus calyciflorus]